MSALGIEEQRVNVVIDITSPRERWDRLGHGYRVEPRIVLWESADVLRVPLSALFRQGDQWAVFVERDGRAELRAVEIGQGTGLQAEVRAGLAAGDRVVLHPADRVVAGSALGGTGLIQPAPPLRRRTSCGGRTGAHARPAIHTETFRAM